MLRIHLAVLAVLVTPGLFGAIELKTPTDGSTVRLLHSNEKAMYKFATREERKARLQADKDAKSGYFKKGLPWREAKTITLEWSCTEKEKGPFHVYLSETADFKSARKFPVKDDKKPRLELRDIRGGLKIATTYWWKVALMNGAESKVGSFTTEDICPRWIRIRGTVNNIRDLGGWKTTDGRRVKQGILYRGQGLNYNSVDGKVAGENRLTVMDLDYMKKTLGIRSDLDLRSQKELGDLAVSPLGSDVKFIHNSAPCYKVFDKWSKERMLCSFRAVNDPANLPMYFHCIGGADRTGTLAYMLNGLLGVPEHDLDYDWELTFYPHIPDFTEPENADFWCRIQHIQQGLAKYGKPEDTLQRRIELYLLDCGVTPEEIAAFRARMLD